MSIITAGFDGNNITITGSGSPISIPLTYFNNLPVPPMPEMEGVKNAFEAEQQTINFLDTLKDASPLSKTSIAATINNLGMYPESKHQSFLPLGDALNKLEHETFTQPAIKSYISDYAWTKLKKKNNSLGPKLNYSNIFFDCGLSPAQFVTQEFKVLNTFGTYMDPSTAGSTSTTYWPPKNTTLVFDKSFMNVFGFPNSKISAKAQGNGKWNYNLLADGTPYAWNGSGPDTNHKYFAGNNEKNKILKASGNEGLKKSLMMLKEWGDKFQVLTAMVWSRSNRNETYAIMTNDKVVVLLCTILKLDCIQYASKREDKKRMHTIRVYGPSVTPNKDAAKRYNITRKDTEKYNKEYIRLIRYLYNHPETPIVIAGLTDTISFPQGFYKAILVDLGNIQKDFERAHKSLVMSTILETLPSESPYNAVSIERKIKDMKNDYTFDVSFRKIAGKIKMLQKTNYTSTIREKPSFVDPPFNMKSVRGMSFYAIGKRSLSLVGGAPSVLLGEGAERIKGMSPEAQERRDEERRRKFKQGIDSDTKSFGRKKVREEERTVVREQKQQEKRNELSWNDLDDTDFYSDPIYDLQEVQGVTDSTLPNEPFLQTKWVNVDINKKLRDNIKSAIARNPPYITIFDTVYSSVLHWSYVNDGVPLEVDDLFKLIFNPEGSPYSPGIFKDLALPTTTGGMRRTRKRRKNNKKRTTRVNHSRKKIKKKMTIRKKRREKKSRKKNIKKRTR
jgi:hypothetical protein